MADILHIDARPHGVSAWKQAHPSNAVDYLDLGHSIIPLVDEPLVAVPEQRKYP